MFYNESWYIKVITEGNGDLFLFLKKSSDRKFVGVQCHFLNDSV